jgi:2-polyprenyl-3-methyl-5-hydroxy-6-metoxy-1,4-benzoquinol methylase
MRIEDLSVSLTRNADGIYVASGSHDVSYPSDGHAQCFQVEDHSFWFKHRNECIAAMVARHPFTGALLDIGGGNGYVSQKLAALGLDVVLIEPGRTGALNAHQRGLANVICATVEEAGLAPGSFGAIGMFDVIEHVEDDHAFLSTIAPLLKPDGMLYLTVPCYGWLWSEADVEAGHFRRHSRQSLQTLVGDQFDIEYSSYFFTSLVLPQFLLRALPYRLGVRRHKVLSDAAEHGAGNGLTVRLLERLLERETAAVAAGRQKTFGASCLVAARHRSWAPGNGSPV